MHSFLHEITICIGVAWLLGLVANFLRQPALLAYLVGGFLVGPQVLRWIHSLETIHMIAELGLIFLLFMIGLEIDLKKIVAAGKSITVTALVQIGAGAALGLGFFLLCGFPVGEGKWDAVYLAVAAALSSTVIIVKLLYDKQELDTLPGRITLGVLVLQDLFVILFLGVQPNLDTLAPSVLVYSLLRVVVLVATAMVISRYVLPPLFKRVARLPELVQVGALAWCFLVGELGERLQLSREMGALIAGVSLSTFPYAIDVTARVTSLRDFFITLFFVGLGMQIPMPTGPLLMWAVVFAAFVVVSRAVTTFLPLYFMRQGLRTSLLPAINLSQVSEFSLVVISLGLSAGHFARPETSGAVALAFVMLATLSTFCIGKSGRLVRVLVPWLKARGLKDLDTPSAATMAVHGNAPEEHGVAHGHSARILILGFFRPASSLYEELTRHCPDLINDVVVVDFSPAARTGLVARGGRVIYGDISNRDTLVHAGIENAEVIISTVHDNWLKGTSNERLIRLVRSLNGTAKVIATCDVLAEIRNLYAAGADYVSVPRLLEADDVLVALRAATEGLLEQKRASLDVRLQNRGEVLS